MARASDQVTVASYMPEKADHNADQYQNAVQEVLSAPDFVYKVAAGSRYRLVGDVNAFNFTTDAQQRVYIVITVIDYPERLVFPLINEIIPQFKVTANLFVFAFFSAEHAYSIVLTARVWGESTDVRGKCSLA